MKRFIEGENRSQSTLFPESLDDYIAEDNAVRVVDAFVNKLDLKQLGFDRAEPSATGRPGYQSGNFAKDLCVRLSEPAAVSFLRWQSRPGWRWEHEHRLETADVELKKNPDAMGQRKRLVEHPYGTIKYWMGSTHVLMRRLPNVQAETRGLLFDPQCLSLC